MNTQGLTIEQWTYAMKLYIVEARDNVQMAKRILYGRGYYLNQAMKSLHLAECCYDYIKRTV